MSCIVGVVLLVRVHHRHAAQAQTWYDTECAFIKAQQYTIDLCPTVYAGTALSRDAATSDQKKTDEQRVSAPALQMHGTVISTRYAPFVIIEYPAGKQQLFRLGDYIETWRIVQIAKDACVLEQQGVQKKYSIKQTDTESKEAVRDMYQEVPQPLPCSRLDAVKQPEAIIALSDHEWMINPETFKEYLNNASHIMSQVRIQPYFNDGKPQGFHIAYIADDCILSKCGIQAGDIIEKINGELLNNPFIAMRMLGSFQEGARISLDLRREDKIQTLKYYIARMQK